MHHLSVEDPTSYFQDQWDQFLSSARSRRCTDLNFVSKSGELVSAHQALLLPLSSHLKLLVESSQSCGCVEDVPTLLLPDWGHGVIEALVNLIYSGSVTVTGDVIGEFTKLVNELRFDLSPDQLIAEPLVNSPVYAASHSNSGNSLIPIEEALAAENQMATISTIKSEDAFYDNSTEKKKDWIHNDETERENEEQEQERVVQKLSEMILFLDQAHIKNKDTIKKPLNDLLTSLLQQQDVVDASQDWSDLPEDVVLNLFKFYLKPGDVLAASQTCRLWRIFGENNLLWQKICQEAGLAYTLNSADLKFVECRTKETTIDYSPWKVNFLKQFK